MQWDVRWLVCISKWSFSFCNDLTFISFFKVLSFPSRNLFSSFFLSVLFLLCSIIDLFLSDSLIHTCLCIASFPSSISFHSPSFHLPATSLFLSISLFTCRICYLFFANKYYSPTEFSISFLFLSSLQTSFFGCIIIPFWLHFIISFVSF